MSQHNNTWGTHKVTSRFIPESQTWFNIRCSVFWMLIIWARVALKSTNTWWQWLWYVPAEYILANTWCLKWWCLYYISTRHASCMHAEPAIFLDSLDIIRFSCLNTSWPWHHHCVPLTHQVAQNLNEIQWIKQKLKLWITSVPNSTYNP